MKALLFLLLLPAAFNAGAQQVDSYVISAEPSDRKNNAPFKYGVVNNEVRTGSDVIFSPGTAELLPVGLYALKTVKKYLDDKKYITLLRVEGHVSAGTGPGAQALSEARAKAVCSWLVANGVDCRRLLPVGFGSTKPQMDSHNEISERITFVNASLRGKPIGGMPVDGGGKSAGDPCIP